MSSDDRPSHQNAHPQPFSAPARHAPEQEAEKLEEASSLEVSRRRRAEENLAHTQERLRLMIAGVEDYAFFVVNTAGLIEMWNAGASKLFGYSNDEAIGQPFEIIFTPEDREAGVPGQELKTAAEQSAANDDRWHVKKDGTRFWAHGVTTALSGDGTRGFAKLVRDLTPQEQAEEKLRESEARYRRKAEELAEVNQQKDRFLAELSHELRNPLAPIRTATELICGRPHQDTALREACDILRRQVGVLARLVDDLLEASRITSGKVRLQKEVLDMRDIARNAAHSTRTMIEANRQQLSVSLPEQAAGVEADPVRIEQVIVNLLTNAAKFTPAGGNIWLSVGREQDTAVVRVKDNGEGISSETVPTLFSLFSQAHRSLDRANGGMGIGLALARNLVEMHGGTVEAHSEGPGKGSEFVVRLPLSSQQIKQTEVAQSEPPEKLSLRILVVDDNASAATLMAILLRATGCDVRTENSGAAGLETAEKFRPDVIILDIGMPGMNGYELARRIRRNPELEQVRLIAVTGFDSESHRQQSRDAGIDHHLVKPVESATLITLLSEVELLSD